MFKKSPILLVVVGITFLLSMLSGSATADPRIRYQELNWTKGGYDYAPSILWDGNQWVMYHCGFFSSTNSDAIFRSISSDGVNWSSPTVVLTIGTGAAWDSGHICDPTVLAGVSIAGYSWAMWYTGIPHDTPGPGPNRMGLALSHDGLSWTKYGGNPVIDCGSNPAYWGCGQPSVVKVGSTYYLSHTEIVPNVSGNRARESSDGLSWTFGTLFFMPTLDVGPDFMYASGKWYSIAGSSQSGGPASDLRVYVSDSMSGPKTLIGVLTYAETPKRYIAEQGFYRNALGNQLANSPDIWFAYGLASNQFHDPSEEIEAAKLAIMDGEQNSVDSLLGGQACSGVGPSISAPMFAWDANGPKGDDINYWTVTADGDGVDEYCDIRLQNFPNRDFSAGSQLEITWFGWATGGTTTNPTIEVWFQNGANYVLLGYLTGVQNTKYVTTFTLPADRSNVTEILFRIHENYWTNLQQSGAQMRGHLFKVQLINPTP